MTVSPSGCRPGAEKRETAVTHRTEGATIRFDATLGVGVTISKMNSGKRRPCCFNLSACTDPDLSKNGRLLELGEDRI
jgi:hypothetical protein